MYEVDLDTGVRGRSRRQGESVRGTHAVRQVCDEILDLDISALQLTVQPALSG